MTRTNAVTIPAHLLDLARAADAAEPDGQPEEVRRVAELIKTSLPREKPAVGRARLTLLARDVETARQNRRREAREMNA